MAVSRLHAPLHSLHRCEHFGSPAISDVTQKHQNAGWTMSMCVTSSEHSGSMCPKITLLAAVFWQRLSHATELTKQALTWLKHSHHDQAPYRIFAHDRWKCRPNAAMRCRQLRRHQRLLHAFHGSAKVSISGVPLAIVSKFV